MYALSNLLDMIRRDLADYDDQLNTTFLLGKLADSAAELSLYVPSIKVIDTGDNYYLETEPIDPVKRLISLNAAIDYLTIEYSTLKKTSEKIDEPGLSYSYSVASNVVRVSLESLLKKRDQLLNALSADESFSSEYLDLIILFKEKDAQLSA